jgi:hypothetical protein
LNKTRGQWSQLHSKPKRDGFGGGGGQEGQLPTLTGVSDGMGRPKENVLGKSYTNCWLVTSALQREAVMVPTFMLNEC